MIGKLFLGFLLFLAVDNAISAHVIESNYNVTAVCTAVPLNTNLGSIMSCDSYYTCTSDGPVYKTCDSGLAFDVSTQKCVTSSQVSCYSSEEEPCTTQKEAHWEPVKDYCHSYYYCKDNVLIGKGSCPYGSYFDASSQQCLSGDCSDDSATGGGTRLSSLCQVVPPGFYFGSTEACGIWNYCTTAKALKTGTCATEYPLFNVEKKACDYGSTCSRYTGIVMNPEPAACTQEGALSGDSSVCGTYYVCTNGENVPKYCAEGKYFCEKTLACQDRKTAQPAQGCDRCQYATTQFVNAVDYDTCNEYYYCKNNVGSLKHCNDNFYFNEGEQACRPDTHLLEYAASNGACAGAQPATDTEAEDTETTLDPEA